MLESVYEICIYINYMGCYVLELLMVALGSGVDDRRGGEVKLKVMMKKLKIRNFDLIGLA